MKTGMTDNIDKVFSARVVSSLPRSRVNGRPLASYLADWRCQTDRTFKGNLGKDRSRAAEHIPKASNPIVAFCSMLQK